jgi:hypothetical protein
MVTLQERLDEFKKSSESGVPPYNAQQEAIETMHRATEELKAAGLEERAFKVGDCAPSFTLFNQDHLKVDSADLLLQRATSSQLLSRALVTSLQYGAGGSTADPFRGTSLGCTKLS